MKLSYMEWRVGIPDTLRHARHPQSQALTPTFSFQVVGARCMSGRYCTPCDLNLMILPYRSVNTGKPGLLLRG